MIMLSAIFVLIVIPVIVVGQPPCIDGLFFGTSLITAPIEAPLIAKGAEGQACAWACRRDSACMAFEFVGQGYAQCTFERGCCHLLAGGSWNNATWDATGYCGAIVRPQIVPPQVVTTQPSSSARNVLHIIVDDLRPDLAPFGPEFMSTPALSAFAKSASLFSRAYCNIAVCSPSRLSFLSGRRPTHAKQFNFINHFRQAQCEELIDVTIAGGPVTKSTFVQEGGSGQCCSNCAVDPSCAAWNLLSGGVCNFHAFVMAPKKAVGTISGRGGGYERARNWTTIPGIFLRANYSVFGSGKVFHTEEGGSGPPPWDGMGMPPLQDPVSWSREPNATMGDVNAVAPMWPCAGPSDDPCGEPGDAEGNPGSDTTKPFEDRVILDEAVDKLNRLASDRARGGAPFYLAVGFRKPHLPHRHPSFFSSLYPVDNVTLAKYDTLDESVPVIAYHSTALAKDPFSPLPNAAAALERAEYYAATSWIDHQVGTLLAALAATGLEESTLVVFHADHGWSLGEYGEYEKFTNWEHGTRVPLLVRAPWLPASAAGAVIDAPVELVDLLPTIADLAGVRDSIPPGEIFDGFSLAPVIAGGPPPPRNYSLSVYPRCPANEANSSLWWQNNDCVRVERGRFFAMGASIRTERWRYTEWAKWDGAQLQPDWSDLLGVELYDHLGDDGRNFDAAFEVKNLAEDASLAPVRAALSSQLRAAYALNHE